jgi:hypothetical protein
VAGLVKETAKETASASVKVGLPAAVFDFARKQYAEPRP